MRRNWKTIIITILIWAGFIPYCSFTACTKDTKLKQPTAFELLDRYAENQDKLKSFIAKTESVSKHSSQNDPAKQVETRRTVSEFRYEKSGSNSKAYYWFRYDKNRREDGTWFPADRCHSVLWDGEFCYDYSKSTVLDSSRVYVMSDKEYIKQAIAIGYEGTGPILGILYGNLDRFDSILRQSNSISVRSKLEKVGSANCFVIDAKTKHGNYTIWLDPKHGYGVAKAIVHQGPEHFLHGRPISSYNNADSYKGHSFSLENVRFENVEGVWIPMEADYRLESQEQNGIRIRNDHYKITQIEINPDHDELKSFVLDVQNGTEVRILGAPGSTYTWREGMKFIIDKWDGSIKYVPEDWSILISTGKPLPQFQGINLRQSVEQIENRTILLCFFDMEQRPSRYYILQLTKQAEKLKRKGVTVIAVQASKIGENKLKDWVKKYKIPLLVGMIESNEEKIRFAWGIRSLPWLILTDKNHIVRAEDFTLSELGEKIKEAAP